MHAAAKCEANTYGWACESECKCRSDKHCNRFTGPTPQCRCKDGFFNPPECEPGTYGDDEAGRQEAVVTVVVADVGVLSFFC